MADDAEDEDTRKYAPLGRYLAALPPAQAGVRLTFAGVERIIDAPLPPSATEHHHQWWANQSRGSRAPHWDAAGFKVDGVDLSRRLVRFTRKTAGERPPRALSLQDVVTELNALSPAYDVGALPQWLKDHKNLTRAPSATMFFSTVDPTRDWVFHAGGLTELQFNVGFEPVDGEWTFRHGVAFSLQPTREIPDIAPLVPKIERFNEYLRIYPDALEGFSMWHWHNGNKNVRKTLEHTAGRRSGPGEATKKRPRCRGETSRRISGSHSRCADSFCDCRL